MARGPGFVEDGLLNVFQKHAENQFANVMEQSCGESEILVAANFPGQQQSGGSPRS